MKQLLKISAGLLVAYLTYRILSEYLRPTRVKLDEYLDSNPPPKDPPRQTQSSGTQPRLPSEQETDLLNVNQADEIALIALPGVGPALAKRILARRQQIGAFASLQDLTQVQGIGPILIERLRPLVKFY